MRYSAKNIVTVFIIIVGIVVLAEKWLDVYVFQEKTIEGKEYCYLRSTLRSENNPDYIAQPYLGYSNHPQPASPDSSVGVNMAGIKRTEETTIKKEPGTYRILFLGGPSTFSEVRDLRNTFPMLIETELNKQIARLSEGRLQKAECLNAGLRGATSAELLTEYLFKFRYYEPDLIVIHAGFNDAFTYLCRSYNVPYQPDYHTAKKVCPREVQLSHFVKLLMVSRLASYIIIRSVYGDLLANVPQYNPFFKYKNSYPWFTYGNDSIFSAKYNAMYNNISTLVSVAQAAHQEVLLVPEFYYKYDTLFGRGNETFFKESMLKNDTFFMQIATEKDVPLCHLDINNFSTDMFPDGEDRYVNEKGEKMKAKLILPYIVSELNKKSQLHDRQ